MNIGDRVVCIIPTDNISKGMQGTIRDLNLNNIYKMQDIAVEWDDIIPGGHTLANKCLMGHGWWIFKRYIEVINSTPIKKIKRKRPFINPF